MARFFCNPENPKSEGESQRDCGFPFFFLATALCAVPVQAACTSPAGNASDIVYNAD